MEIEQTWLVGNRVVTMDADNLFFHNLRVMVGDLPEPHAPHQENFDVEDASAREISRNDWDSERPSYSTVHGPEGQI